MDMVNMIYALGGFIVGIVFILFIGFMMAIGEGALKK